MEAALTPGDAFSVAVLDTRHGPVRVGMMICYDREFPESARVLMLEGAEIILVPNACDLTEDRIGQFRTRAFENMVAVAMTNYPSPQCNGHSCAFDGVAFTADAKARDHLLRDYQAKESWGDAYREPYAYGPLVRDRPCPPFVRDDARRDAPGD